MPMHDWTRVDAGTYHDFHQGWTIELRNALNRGILPSGYMAMADQRVVGFEPDVTNYDRTWPGNGSAGLAVVQEPPRTRMVGRIETEAAAYARKANRLVVRTGKGRVVSIIEIVSPGNKDSFAALEAFAAKFVEFVNRGVHVLLVDPFPPTARDPLGIHEALWERLVGEPFEKRPPDKPLTAAGYDAGDGITAYVEPLAVGDCLPDMPLFLDAGRYVQAPLEASYMASWRETPAFIRDQVEPAPTRD